jgi:ubiquinone/menaquinone biosynthesis C-methylase UbiE
MIPYQGHCGRHRHTQVSRGINFPRLYDLSILLMTRGRDLVYRADLLDLAGIAPGEHVLDVGCGTGTQAIMNHTRVQSGGSGTGVDISPNMLAVARRKARRAGLDIMFHRAHATRLPFDDARFDVVTITTVVHMLPQGLRQPCLDEAWRVLKNGGRLLLFDYAGDPRKRKGLMAKHGAHGRFDLYALREPLSEAGFKEITGGPLDWLDLHFLRAVKISPGV